jgi:hypothetical protein
MRRLEAKPMTGFNDTPIDKPEAFSVVLASGKELGYDDVISVTPAVTSAYDVCAQPQLVLGSEEGLPAWDEEAHYPVGRLATFHGRNLEVLADRVKIQDRFGNVFRSLGIKGSDYSDPHFFKSETASREVIVNGLQESLVMERILRVSRLLREHGVGTEYICGLSIPETFPLDKHDGDVDTKTAVPFAEFFETLAARYAAENQNGKSALEIKAELIERLSDCDYLVTYRALDCPYRFGELLSPDKFAELQQFRIKAADNPIEAERIEKQTLTGYLQQEFVPTLARNLAKFHNLGLVHKFLHRDNITALGSIVDLDSVEGEALGLGDTFENTGGSNRSQKLTAQIRDLFQAMHGIELVANYAHDDEVPTDSLTEQFLSTYMTEAFKTEAEQDDFVEELLSHAYSISYLAEDASAMHHCCQLIFGAYVNLHPEILETIREDIPLPDQKIDPRFRRKGSMYFSLFPTALIKGWRKQILKDPNPYHRSEVKGDIALNSTKLMIKNQLAIHFVAKMFGAKRSGQEIPVRQMMAALGCMLGEFTPGDNWEDLDPDPEIDQRLEEMQAYFYEQNKLFLSRLVRYQRPDRFYKEAHEALTSETQRELRDYTAEAWMHNTGRCPVFYVKNESQYAKIFDELGLNEDTEVEYVDIRGMVATPDYESKSTMILADYSKAPFVACHYWKDSALTELFTSDMLSGQCDEIKPTIMIRDVFGTPKVQIIRYPESDAPEPFKEKGDYQDLLEEATPNLVEPRQLILSI